MNCPNCSETFRLVADYSTHVQRCRPLDVTVQVSEWLLRKLNAATESIDLELSLLFEEEAAALVA